VLAPFVLAPVVLYTAIIPGILLRAIGGPDHPYRSAMSFQLGVLLVVVPAAAALALTVPFSSPFADRFGARRVLVVLLVAYVLSQIALISALEPGPRAVSSSGPQLCLSVHAPAGPLFRGTWARWCPQTACRVRTAWTPSSPRPSS
jgi:MFS family permease